MHGINLASSFSSATAFRLTGESTASDVLRELGWERGLAPYADAETPGTAVVTGGDAGIGAETASALVRAGMRVVVCTNECDSGIAFRESLSEEF